KDNEYMSYEDYLSYLKKLLDSNNNNNNNNREGENLSLKPSLLESGDDVLEIDSLDLVKESLPSVKGYTRTNSKSFSSDPLSISKIRNIYLVSHLTNTDLSLLSDFESFKEDLNIVNKSFVTLNK